MKRFFQLLILVMIFSCGKASFSAQEIIDQSIETHGCNTFYAHSVLFDFREYEYSVDRSIDPYVYTRKRTDSTGVLIDSLFSSSLLKRYISDTLVSLDAEWQTKYANSVNSVLYFFQLPCLLNDPAVIKELVGTTQIEGELYYQIKVQFKAEGGGDDFQDVYMYWIHSTQYTMDYLAYNYQVEGGGTRFRKAINRRKVNGLIVQDYINFKAEEKFPLLENLPVLYEKGQLQELSRINNENVLVN